MLDLLIIMLERLGVIIAVAFILTRFSFFKNLIKQDVLNPKQEIKVILFFAMFGITGTYLGFALSADTLMFNSAVKGIATDEAIANSRVIGIVVAGLLGGYRVGLGAGLIAGIHRMALGGFTAFSCGISTIIAGLLSGYFYKKRNALSPVLSFFIGASAEALQMSIILLVSKPFDQSLALVKVIGIPMILANGVGTAIFMLIIHSVIGDEKRTIASEAEKTLRIANQTIKYLREGLTPSSAKEVCTILYNELNAIAVAMTNKTNVLAYVGLNKEFYENNNTIQTSVTKEVLASGEMKHIVNGSSKDRNKYVPMDSAIIAPLKEKDKTIGTLKVYYSKRKADESINTELIKGLSKLLSEQLRIGQAEKTLQLAKEAEINALQAQINPHFLFNSINIIISLIRTNPEEARTLLNELSVYIRKNVTGRSAKYITLKEELSHVKAYLAINEARFVDRLHVHYELDFSAMEIEILPFILQPLVENSIQHGFSEMDEKCELTISILQKANHIHVKITDNGKGIKPERIQSLLHQEVISKTGTGIGLYNVNRRLVMNFGEQSRLHITSNKNEGTTVSFKIKIKEHL